MPAQSTQPAALVAREPGRRITRAEGLGRQLATAHFARYSGMARLSRLVRTGSVIVLWNHSRPRWHTLVRPGVTYVRLVAADERRRGAVACSRSHGKAPGVPRPAYSRG